MKISIDLYFCSKNEIKARYLGLNCFFLLLEMQQMCFQVGNESELTGDQQSVHCPTHAELDREALSWQERFGKGEEIAESLASPTETQLSGLYREAVK